MDKEKSHLSREVREYRTSYLTRIAAKSSEETALVLAAIYKYCIKDRRSTISNQDVGMTIDEIISSTLLNKAKIREAIIALNSPDLIRKIRKGTRWTYIITEDGVDALTHMLNEHNFLGRKQKITAILEMTKEGKN